jgi:hypothetical protein
MYGIVKISKTVPSYIEFVSVFLFTQNTTPEWFTIYRQKREERNCIKRYSFSSILYEILLWRNILGVQSQ